ncbi:2-oxoglutarate dehydrogenase E1 subunit family protein, partial [Mycobacterium colombiense]|uniref:2-oxoglutarate dehydrogenase E1 subunit family protein n=1 Tax=Mycobacterium colombiense TaxID=339268 RepID=UPI000A898FC9
MSNISSPFGQNEWLVEEMYRKFRDDPSSVDPSWHEFLVDYNPEPAGEPASAAPTSNDGPVVDHQLGRDGADAGRRRYVQRR